MKKLVMVICLALACILFLNANAFASAAFKVIQRGKDSELFGKAFKVKKMQVSEAIKKNGKEYYACKFIIQRPSNDDSWGRARLGPYNFRLYYWAALTKINVFNATYHKGLEVYQDINENPNNIDVYLLDGLEPGKYEIQLAIFPYPMSNEYHSFKDYIQFARGPYVTFLEALGKALAVTTPQGATAVFIGEVSQSVVKDEIINAALIHFANQYGQLVEVEIFAKMPKITTRYAKDAADLLYKKKLKPSQLTKTIPTENIRLDGRVAWSQYNFGDPLSVGTKVKYKLYKYQPDLDKVLGEWEGNSKNITGKYVVWIHKDERRCCSGDWNGVAPYTYHGTTNKSVRSGAIILKKFTSKNEMLNWVCKKKEGVSNYHNEAWGHINGYVVKMLPCR